MSKTKLVYWFFLVLLGSFFCACKTQEKDTVKIKVKPRSSKFLVNKLLDNEFKFNTISTKAAVSFDNGKKISFKTHLRIRKDSAIWVSITPLLGIEIARVLITQDTIKIMNRSSSEYFIGGYDYINNMFAADLDYQMLEALLIGNSLDFEVNNRIHASVDRKKNLYFVSTEKKRKVKKEIKKDKVKIKKQAQALWLDPSTFKIKELLLTTPQTNHSLNCTYSEYEENETQLFPHNLHLLLRSDTSSTIDINYNKISTDKSLTFPFTIPTKYVEIKK